MYPIGLLSAAPGTGTPLVPLPATCVSAPSGEIRSTAYWPSWTYTFPSLSAAIPAG